MVYIMANSYPRVNRVGLMDVREYLLSVSGFWHVV